MQRLHYNVFACLSVWPKSLARQELVADSLLYCAMLCQFWTAHSPPATPAGVALTGKLKLIELQKLLQYLSNDGFQPVFNHVAFTTDGKKAKSLNNFVYSHDVKNDGSINLCICHTKGVHTVAFSP